MTAVWIAIIAVFIATAVFWFTTANRPKPTPADQRWIVSTLESIREEADRRRLHPNAEAKFDVDAAFDNLRDMVSKYPGPLQETVESLAKRWRELSRQYAEFQNQDAGSTLQNSIITQRTSKIANEIGELIDEIKEQLQA